MKNALMLGVALLLLGASAAAQTTSASKSDRRAGTISGRLTDTAGQPIPNAVVYVAGTSLRLTPRNTSTDEQGRFRITDLTRGVYTVWPGVPGYVLAEDESQTRRYRAGDTVNFTVAKGGVITGTVLTHTNEPMTGCSVQAILIRDKDGHPVTVSRPGPFALADDRGVYRLYGLLSGTYIVLASGKLPYVDLPSVYENDLPTYYPSSTRDTAQAVIVQAGEEASGIDIRYRGERGHAISGKVTGLPADAPSTSFSLQLFNVASRTMEAQTYVGAIYPGGNNDGFAFYGVADGEYLITAATNGFNSPVRGSGRARIKVNGADATGVAVTLVPYGAIAGTLLIEPLRTAEGQSKCEIKRRFQPDEMLIEARPEKKADEFDMNAPGVRQESPSDKGEFTIAGMVAGQYRVGAAMVGEDYFVRSLTLSAPGKSQPPVDAARNPLTVKAGERLNDLTVTIAEGAAAVRGRVVPATENARLPDRLRVHLVPAEKEAANDLLRFAEARAGADGAFTINNLAPGRYLIVARPAADDEMGNEATRPIAWKATERAALLKQAAAANLTLDLQPCQRLIDYVLKYTPPAPMPTRKKNQ